MKNKNMDWAAYWRKKRKKKSAVNIKTKVISAAEVGLPHITIYTDGSFSGKYACTGWSAIIMEGSQSHALYEGYLPGWTNNMMEMLAFIRGLEVLNTKCNVRVVSDSMYIVQAIQDRWIESWKRNGWITKAGKPVANRDYWERLDELIDLHNVTVCWHRAHSDEMITDDQKGNDLADHFAKLGREEAELQLKLSRG